MTSLQLLMIAGMLVMAGVAGLIWWASPAEPDLADALDRLSPRPTGNPSTPIPAGDAGEWAGRWAIRRLPNSWVRVPVADLAVLRKSVACDRLARQELLKDAASGDYTAGTPAPAALIELVEWPALEAAALAGAQVWAGRATAGALTRQESRRGHWRSDFPLTDKTGRRSSMTLADADRIAAGAPAPLRRVFL